MIFNRNLTRFHNVMIHGVCALILLAMAESWAAGEVPAPSPTLDASYPGGNIAIEKIEGDTFILKTDLRDTQAGEWWFYWNFRVRGAGGRTLHFRFATPKCPIGARGPALSPDGGLTWRWLGADSYKELPGKKGWEFSYAFAPTAGDVRFACAIPYLQSDLERFLARYRGNPHLKVGELCKSRKGRGVECLRLGRLDGEPKARVLLTARHHACESMANYEQEGIIEAILADTPEGRLWRDNIEVMIVPFMDKDGVEDGDQGKNRAPHDHNRDYGIASLYPEVRALTTQVPAWLKGKPFFGLDMHCPYLYGVRDHQHAYFVGTADQAMWQKVLAFARILAATPTGPNPYKIEDNLPYGTSWNTAANTAQKAKAKAAPKAQSPGAPKARASTAPGGGPSHGWMQTLPNALFASCLEFPYADAHGTEVTAESAREFGRGLAHAMLQYLP